MKKAVLLTVILVILLSMLPMSGALAKSGGTALVEIRNTTGSAIFRQPVQRQILHLVPRHIPLRNCIRLLHLLCSDRLRPQDRQMELH